MNAFIAQMFFFLLVIGLSILVMIYGWGLEPQSWWWIIGGGVCMKLMIQVMEYVAKEEK